MKFDCNCQIYDDELQDFPIPLIDMRKVIIIIKISIGQTLSIYNILTNHKDVHPKKIEICAFPNVRNI